MSSTCKNKTDKIEENANNKAQNVSIAKRNAVINNNNNNKRNNNHKDSSSNNESNKEKSIKDVWTKDNFNNNRKMNKHELNLNLRGTKMSWTNKSNKSDEPNLSDDDETNANDDNNETTSPTPSTPDKDNVTSPSHYARRPMNAFLIFCKKHRPKVREKYPNLENRGVTRILGEWWAFLDDDEKKSFVALAKEYKDAFFLAHPDFKWYKLPAPPLRTLSTRPLTVQRETSPLRSPNESSHGDAQFTPGKLADESQLGMLTSLLNSHNNYTTHKSTDCVKIKTSSAENCANANVNNNNNNNIDRDNLNDSDVKDGSESCLKKDDEQNDTLPLMPLKKRHINPQDNNNEARTVRNSSETRADETHDITTKQEFYEKVVDSMFSSQTNGRSKLKEARKSGRTCKGKLYQQFMVHGKLLKSKREKKSSDDYSLGKMDAKLEKEFNLIKIENQTPRLRLDNTIKRLAERTNTKLESNNNSCKRIKLETNNDNDNQELESNGEKNSETFQNAHFDLESRIEQLPHLSYENYLKRKRDSKSKKQFKSKSVHNSNHKHKGEHTISNNNNNSNNNHNINNKIPVGSKKRKNKNNITHLEKKSKTETTTATTNTGSVQNTDLSGLETLAEIAANKERINE